MNSNRLYRDEQYKKIGGVCAGLAEYFNVDVSLVRVLFVLAVVLGGGGGLAYLILWIIVPAKPLVSPADEFFNSSQSQSVYEDRPFVTPGFEKKKDHKGRYIGGLILIVLGVFIMLEEYDIVPDIDFNLIWPVGIIVLGLIFIFGFWTKHPQDNSATTLNNPSASEISSTDNSQSI
jgi:phage shock protein C